MTITYIPAGTPVAAGPQDARIYLRTGSAGEFTPNHPIFDLRHGTIQTAGGFVYKTELILGHGGAVAGVETDDHLLLTCLKCGTLQPETAGLQHTCRQCGGERAVR